MPPLPVLRFSLILHSNHQLDFRGRDSNCRERRPNFRECGSNLRERSPNIRQCNPIFRERSPRCRERSSNFRSDLFRHTAVQHISSDSSPIVPPPPTHGASYTPAASSTSTSSTEPQTSNTLSTEELPPLGYHVGRTASKQLPIYHDSKGGGGTQRLTKIQKITGSPEALRRDLVQALSLPEERVWVNRVTGHVMVKVRWPYV